MGRTKCAYTEHDLFRLGVTFEKLTSIFSCQSVGNTRATELITEQTINLLLRILTIQVTSHMLGTSEFKAKTADLLLEMTPHREH